LSARGGDVRTPPHSIEAEQAVLGGLLLDSQSWDNVADVVGSADFYRPDHRLIFDAIAQVAALGKPADAVTVSECLERSGKLVDAGGLAYLGSLVRDTATAANVRAYAGIVRERSLLRQLYSPTPLLEQMTWFWSNHFSVFGGKADLRAAVGDCLLCALRFFKLTDPFGSFASLTETAPGSVGFVLAPLFF
jgi:hypothetical protein